MPWRLSWTCPKTRKIRTSVLRRYRGSIAQVRIGAAKAASNQHNGCSRSIRLKPQFGADQFVDRLGVGLAACGFHHLTDEPAGQFGVCFGFFYLRRVVGDDLIYSGFDRSGEGSVVSSVYGLINVNALGQILGDCLDSNATGFSASSFPPVPDHRHHRQTLLLSQDDRGIRKARVQPLHLLLDLANQEVILVLSSHLPLVD